MAPNLAVTRRLLREAGGLVMEEPYAYLASARNFVKNECKIHPLAFGIAAIPAVTVPYYQSQGYQEENLDKGVTLFEDISKGLAVAAGLYDSMEQANTVTPDNPVAVDPGNPDSPGIFDSGGGAPWPSVELYAKWLVAMVCGVTCTGMTPFAIGAPLAWGLVQPDDAAIAAAIAGWQSAEAKLAGVTFSDVISRLDEGDSKWEGDGREAFDTFIAWVANEVEQSKSAATTNASALETVKTTLDTMVLPFMAFSLVSLALVILYYACSFLPFVGPAFNALCHIQGAMLSAVSALQASGQTAMVLLALGGVVGSIALGRGFADKQPNLGPGTDFDQLTISWAEPVV